LSDKAKFILILFLAGLVLTLAIIGYLYRSEIRIPGTLQGDRNILRLSGIYVKCTLVADINDQCLRLKWLISCMDMKQKRDVVEKLPRIKHELFMSISRPEVGLAFEQRDFDVMKEHLLMAVNNFTVKPVKKVYIEKYFFN